ncbi:hypothetical protein Afe04nite_38660 [Asanoa ferruginea]|nr:hypothetical protein Afe04nite_38660 [Asanoa ferruginea]
MERAVAALLVRHRPGTPFPDRDVLTQDLQAIVAPTAGLTVGRYLIEWLDGRQVAATTRHSYAQHIRLYLGPHLGHLLLRELTCAHIQAMYAAIGAQSNEIAAARNSDDPDIRQSVRGRRPLSAATLHKLHSTLHKALSDAVRKHHLIPHNPAAAVELPDTRRPRARVWRDRDVAEWKRTGRRPSPVMVWTPPLAGAFLDHIETACPTLYPMFLLMLHRGLRRGEACGLLDRDVDLGHLQIVITQTITTVGYQTIVKPVKTPAARRTLPLAGLTAAVLREYVAERAQWARRARAWPDHGLFFVQPTGAAWHPKQLTDRFDQLVRSSGMPPVRLHDLRHCAATYLRHAGGDLKEVQETLGHAAMEFTADSYVSVLPERHIFGATAAADLIPRGKFNSTSASVPTSAAPTTACPRNSSSR